SIFSSFSIRKVEIYSLKGEKLIESDVENVSISLDVSTLPKGIYLVKVYTPQGVATKKLVVN
ncbi:MAG: T9SS type A sorting domain-containing protein, partial [Bacteroidales bacterium]|nr:T9SS type A sorting domain-containing protein [Bacteroidales bacterium]